jgi:hypothetical protein
MISLTKRFFSSPPFISALNQQAALNFTGVSLSPSCEPGFVRFDSIECIEPSIVPFEIKDLFVNRTRYLFNLRYRPLLEKLTDVNQIPSAMLLYENQEEWNKLSILSGKSVSTPGNSLNFQANAGGLELEVQNDSQVDDYPLIDGQSDKEPINTAKPKSLLLMSILKWRKRMMRGHKYKKRMKKLRRKAKNNQ